MMELEIWDLINDWKQRVDVQQKENYALAVKYNKYHYGLGMAGIVFTAIAGAALVITAGGSWLKNVLGIVAISAAIFSFAQTFYSHGRRAENYLFAVAQLVQIRRDIEIFEKHVPDRKSERKQRIRVIEERISKVEEETPTEDVKAKIKNWPWILLGLSGAILFIVVLVLGSERLMGISSNQQAAEIWQKESVQQGTVTWEFDPNDPLLEQRTILISTWINEMATQKVITLLAYLNEKDDDAPITIILSSNGGYTKDAYAIVHAMRESPSSVNTVALGDCFSACTKILMGGTGERKIAPDARLAVHTHSYPDDGNPYSINTILFQRENEFFQDYSEIPPEWITNREERFYYLTPEQAVTYKIVDSILE